MSRKKKNYSKIYEKYMNTTSSYENDQFIDFKKMYLQKLDDPDFDQYVEKCKLLTRADGRVDNAFSLYCSGIMATAIFAIGIIASKNLDKPWIIIFSTIASLFIIAFIYFSTYELLKHAVHSDVWNIALVALEAACKEKPRV